MLSLYLVSLGCAKNQVDSEMLLGRLLPNGYKLCQEPQQADLLLINTCAFIEAARTEATEVINELSQAKQPSAKLVVCGCLTNHSGAEIKADFPAVDAWVSIADEKNILEIMDKWFKNTETVIEHPRVRITPPHYAYLRIADGCNHRCSFCSIPSIRGCYISVKSKDLIKEAKRLASEGVVELNLIAQDSSGYGSDLKSQDSLARLLKKLCKIDGIFWIRIQYLYPATMTDELLEVIATEDKVNKYIDLPLQHINDGLLKSMRRPNREFTEKLLTKIKTKIPDVTLRSTFIVGYPGEGEAEYQELKSFIAAGHFNHVGVFAYSHEKDTIAGALDDLTSVEVKNARSQELMLLQKNISLSKNQAMIGETISVLLDELGEDDLMIGRRVADAPDVDNLVFVSGAQELPAGSIIPVRIEQVTAYDLYGTAELEGLL